MAEQSKRSPLYTSATIDVADVVSRPALIIEPARGHFSLQLDRLWAYRELLYFLVWRDVKVRYKQTALGVAWVVLQPLLTTLIFTVLFGLLLKVPSGDMPYPVFALAGLIPWQYFAGALTRTSSSLVGNAHLITKVYFPRLIIPLTGVLSGLVDSAIGFVLLAALLVVYGIWPTAAILLLPAFLLLAMATALGFGLWLAALNVRYRDIGYLVPFLIQIWLYATPVAYGSTLIPERYRWLLGLNPMTGVVEGFRWALLGQEPPGRLFALSVTISVVVLLTGLVYFRRTERTFADVV
ncbi:MAG TPA: ABC transporter permease [Promineifilum sp.]|nr:ABC transporter permease [Promineifilum sp.]HRO89341.1 ABC transporter permease [Promineifilum sp.]HRQ11828.1 ABC transporter permease [Promineifilum sp.]